MEKLYPIKGYEGLYSITKSGRVWSHPRERSSKNGKWLKVNLSGKYSSYCLWKNKKCKNITVHRALAINFIKNPESKRCVNHKDGDKLNNVLENLEWCTHKENTRHAFETGLMVGHVGEKNRWAKLMETDVAEIKKLLLTRSPKVISVMFGVSPNCIRNIRARNTWKQVKEIEHA